MMHTLAGRFYNIILDALVLKCKISSAREETEFTWYCGGEAIDSEVMEGFQDSHESVMLTVFPGLHMGRGTPEFEIVFRAQIESRR